MKRFYSILLLMGLVLNLQAQKKELRNVEKLLKTNAYGEALSSLEAIEGLIFTAENKYQNQYHFLLGQTQQGLKNYKLALEAYRASGDAYKTELTTIYNTLINDLVTAAVEDNGKQDFESAAQRLFMAYDIDKSNTDYLYYAASSAVNGQLYDVALEYYLQLKAMNYTGIVQEYFVTEVKTGEEQKVSEQEYNLYKKSKEYTNHRVQDTESRFPEIVKNIALIYVQQGKIDEATTAIKDARAANPKDIGLILTEADLYIKLDDKPKFAELMQEAIAQDPNNDVLYYNLGVITTDQGEIEKARGYYEKAIALNPDNKNAYLNLVSNILSGESKIVDEMNSLGTSRADNIRYDNLKVERENLYREAVPFLESLLKIDPKDVDALSTLRNIYGTLGETAKFKDLKDRIEALNQ